MDAGRRMSGGQLWRGAAAFLCLLAGSCKDSGPILPEQGTLRIATRFTGIDIPTEVAIAVDSVRLPPLAPGAITTADFTEGMHSVALVGLPANCMVDGTNPRGAIVSAGSTRQLTFNVTCTAITGVVEVRIATEGLDATSQYTVTVGSVLHMNPASESVLSTPLGGGVHAIRLNRVAANCVVAGDNPRNVVVTTGGLTRDTARTLFQVSCGAAFAVAEVTLETSGEDIDQTGFTLVIGDSINHVDEFPGMHRLRIAGGAHTAKLDSVSNNCVVAGGNTAPASVTTGGQTRDTVRLTFRVSCVATRKIVFTRLDDRSFPWITIAHADGSNALALAMGRSPSWSPQKDKVLFNLVYCDDYYYYYGCPNVGLATVVAIGRDRGTVARVSANYNDRNARWSPDGRKIAFVRGATLMVMTVSDSSQAVLVAPPMLGMTFAEEPTWSPDGTRLAFTCLYGTPDSGPAEICVIGANGTGLTAITSDNWTDRKPVWSPDGTTLAFETNRGDPGRVVPRIAFMNPQGGAFTATQTITGLAPAWSPDGATVLFASAELPPGLHLIRRDGGGLARVTSGEDNEPAWRP